MTSNPVTMQAPSSAQTKPLVFLDLKSQFADIRDDVLSAVHRVLESQHFILGKEVEALEEEIAQLTASTFAIGCASGSDALLLALMALGVGPGSEVITTPFTFVATAGSIARLQAKPVFVDIDPETYDLDLEQLASAITPNTKAIIPVHLFGLPSDMSTILTIAAAQNVTVIEDAAQAIGARFQGRAVGSIGAMGCFSFFPSKNLGGAGDGGMITTSDPDFAKRLKILRVHGSIQKYHYELLGMNSRLDALQAAILRVKLQRLEDWTRRRQGNADRYRAFFAELGLENWITVPAHPEDRTHVYNQFVIRIQRRDELRSFLRKAGIPTEIYYPLPLHLQPAFSYLGYKNGELPKAEAASREVLALPIFPELTSDQQWMVVEHIKQFFEQ
ncbi:MAG: degT [Acidobacteriales bacterium]|nr:degT [Terriglobales bacterium]